MPKKYVVHEVKPFKNMKDLMAQAVAEFGDTVAYKYREGEDVREVTYARFNDETNYIGTALYSLGLAEGHVGCAGENSYFWITVCLAALKSNGVFCTIDKDLPDCDLINIINDGEDDIVFCDKKREETFRRIRESIPKVKYFVCFDREEDEGEFLSYKLLMQKGKKLLEEGETGYTGMESDINDLKLLIYTSGTTGLAKGVMLSEQNICSLVFYGLRTSQIRPVGLSVLPYHHAYELVAGILVAIRYGATVCINDSLKRVLKNLQYYKPEYIYLVPAFVEVFYRNIWNNVEKKGKTKAVKAAIKLSNALRKIGIDKRRSLFAEIHEAFGGRLEKIVCGGAPLRPEIGDFFDAIGIMLCSGYGITECSPLVAVNHDDKTNDCRTVGYPLECLDVKIIDPNEEGIGEIACKGETVMMGYYNNPQATAEVFTEDGYFLTGDYGRFNEIGQLIITGRKKNIIILGNGKNIYPEELEFYIGNIPYVTECVVYGARDEDGLETALCAECTVDEQTLANTGREELCAKLKSDIFKACSGLPSYKQVTRAVIRTTPFVKTTSAKIRRDKDGKPL